MIADSSGLYRQLCSLFNGIKRQICDYIETSQLICSANQLTGFYMTATLAFNELMEFVVKAVVNLDEEIFLQVPINIIAT